MVTGGLQAVTVVVGDVDRALATYRDGVGLESNATGRVPASLAKCWARPVLAGRRWVELSAPGDDRPGVIRVIELPGIQAPRPMTSLGWAAAELVVADADKAMARAQEAGCEVLAEPAPVGSAGTLRAGQIAGPAGEALYLTEIQEVPPGFDLPRPIAPVGRVFIAVLASAQLEGSRATLEFRLGARRVTDHALPVRALNRAFGLPTNARHRVSSVQLGNASAIETDQYPAPANTRPAIDGVTGGIVVVSIRGSGPRHALEIPHADRALLDVPAPATRRT